MNPTIGNTTERIMICLVRTRPPDVELPAVARSAAAEGAVGRTVLPRYAGTVCDGGISAVQPSKPSVAKKVEYASTRKEE